MMPLNPQKYIRRAVNIVIHESNPLIHMKAGVSKILERQIPTTFSLHFRFSSVPKFVILYVAKWVYVAKYFPSLDEGPKNP